MTALKVPKRDVHLHLDPQHDKMLRDIKDKLWKDQKRGGDPTDIEGVRHAIVTTHQLMFSSK